jgi:hypothetical protein
MSAQEIIEQIKALAAEERRQVQAYLQGDVAESDASLDAAAARTAGFDAALEDVFTKHDELFRKLAE